MRPRGGEGIRGGTEGIFLAHYHAVVITYLPKQSERKGRDLYSPACMTVIVANSVISNFTNMFVEQDLYDKEVQLR